MPVTGISGEKALLREILRGNGMILSQKITHGLDPESHTQWLVDGVNPAIGTSFEPVWNKSGVYTYATSAETIDIVSSSASDDKDSGTGIRRMIIEGLDANWAYQSESIDLEGLTPVSSANTYIRVNRVTSTAVGSSGSAVGNITIDGNTTANVYGYIPIGENKTELGFYTVPAGKKGMVSFFFATAGTNDSVELKMEVRESADGATAPFVQVAHFNMNENAIVITHPPGTQAILEKSDMRFMVKSASGTAKVSVQANILEWPQ
jgi:hypothetical protein